MNYELTEKEIVEAIKTSTGEEINPKNITVIRGFSFPTYVVDDGNLTFLCRRLRKGIVTIKKVKWW